MHTYCSEWRRKEGRGRGGGNLIKKKGLCVCARARVCQARPGEKIRVWMAAMHLTVNKHITTPCDLLQRRDDISSCRTNSQSPVSSHSLFFFFFPVVCLLDFPFKRRGQILRSSSHISPARKKKGSLLIWRRGGGFRRPGLKVWRAEVGELRLDSARRLETCASAGIISVAVTDSSVCIFVIRSGSLT